ncbi:MAG: DUF3179 domain-containing protein [Hyphomicrobiales bacterium]|nr:DUF3179 domain-containing protein [Hyphomicrobiales bacterium]
MGNSPRRSSTISAVCAVMLCLFLPQLPGLAASERHTATTPLVESVQTAMDQLVQHGLDQAAWDPSEGQPFETVARSADPRLTWAIVDMMKFTWRPEFFEKLKQTALKLTDVSLQGLKQRQEIADHLIAQDVPAYPGYLDHKRSIYTNYIKGWERMFVPGDLDWRLVDWGGVNADDRAYNQTDTICHCIPAVDNPTVQTADQATWLSDDAIIFGIEIDGEARAYPLRIMEVRELVNDTLGGRDLTLPYCSLCGAAQAYFTDRMPEGIRRPIMRTSGLLLRSNKIMFDINTYSLFDTFFGRAVTGPLAQKAVQLQPVTVVTTNWASWVAAHPHTTVLSEDLALGRDYDLRNTRDAHGAIFPIGKTDDRLATHEDVLGVVAPNGQAYAFHTGAALAALKSGQSPSLEGVRLKLTAGGLKAVTGAGAELVSHQAYWFAWSQFHPKTQLWLHQSQ